MGRPDDLMRADGADLGTADLGGEEKRDLERGLKGMKGAGEGGIGCVPVWLDDKVHYSTSFFPQVFFSVEAWVLIPVCPDFYEGMCKTFLWPIFHYLALPDSLDKKTEAESWNAYYDANMVYAKKVAEAYKPGDLVCILTPIYFNELISDQVLDCLDLDP